MESFKVDESKLRFKYLPDYAEYLLENKLEEFVTIGIRFAREAKLPTLKSLSRIPERELVSMSMESNKQILLALRNNTIHTFIERNIENWINNNLDGLVDKSEAIEDLTLAFFVRRRLFSHFLYGYAQSASLQQSITYEVDVYTTQEEILSLKAYMSIQKKLLSAS